MKSYSSRLTQIEKELTRKNSQSGEDMAENILRARERARKRMEAGLPVPDWDPQERGKMMREALKRGKFLDK
jgi:hypothetical protein